MQEVWQRIIVWCEQYAPEIIAGLNPGATKEELRAAETHFGVTFPPQTRELYLLHNGQRDRDAPELFPYSQWLPLADMRYFWNLWEKIRRDEAFDNWDREPDEGVRADPWNPGWLPLTKDAGGGLRCVDLCPTETGKIGQIIEFQDDIYLPLVAPSLLAYLESIATRLESGEYVFSPPWNGVVGRDFLRRGEQWRGVDRNARTALSPPTG